MRGDRAEKGTEDRVKGMVTPLKGQTDRVNVSRVVRGEAPAPNLNPGAAHTLRSRSLIGTHSPGRFVPRIIKGRFRSNRPLARRNPAEKPNPIRAVKENELQHALTATFSGRVSGVSKSL